jgi:tyrosine-protein kinase Etk/Wzc
MRIAEELKAEHFRVTEPVKTSGNPVWPDTFKILVTAIVLGLGSGLGLALLAQIFDNRLQTVKDVETDLGVPFLGGVPFWAHSGLERTIRPIVTEEHSAGAVEAYRALRTSILSALNRLNEKIVLVTSADSREGKTLTALNIAIMIAQMGKKVLLVDMDLRRGRLHRSLGLAREPGVSDALVTGRSLREFAVQTKVENLSLIPTGSSVDNASEILQSTSLVSVFLDVQNDYDYILIDTSPILRVTDTVILATQGVGVVLYVARVNRTPKPLIKYSLDMLGEARVLGLVLNSIEMHKISSLYYAYQYPNYAYYSNAYSYGYSYYSYGDETKASLAPRKRFRRQPRGMASWFGREPSDGG